MRKLNALLNPFWREHFDLVTKITPRVCHERLKQRLASGRPYRTWSRETTPEEPRLTGGVSDKGFAISLPAERTNAFPTDAQGRFWACAGGTRIHVHVGVRPWMAATVAVPLVIFVTGAIRGWLAGYFTADSPLAGTPLWPWGFLALPLVFLAAVALSRWRARADHDVLLSFLRDTLEATNSPPTDVWDRKSPT